MLMGTVAYMAPEQVDAKSVGPAADRYALGLMVYELLSGQRPWDRDTSEGRIYVKLQGGLIPPLCDRHSVRARQSGCYEDALKATS